jgi:hypothetical protein
MNHADLPRPADVVEKVRHFSDDASDQELESALITLQVASFKRRHTQRELDELRAFCRKHLASVVDVFRMPKTVAKPVRQAARRLVVFSFLARLPAFCRTEPGGREFLLQCLDEAARGAP